MNNKSKVMINLPYEKDTEEYENAMLELKEWSSINNNEIKITELNGVSPFHRLFNQCEWKTTKEEKIEGEKGELEISGFVTDDLVERIRHGYTKIYQECKICGNRRTIRQ